MNRSSIPRPLTTIVPREYHQTLINQKDIILTGSVIDSLTLIDAGIKNTIPCHGEFIDDHVSWFKLCGVEIVHICFGANESSQQTAARLKAEGIESHCVDLGNNPDLNASFLSTANAAASFKTLLYPSKKTSVANTSSMKQKAAC